MLHIVAANCWLPIKKGGLAQLARASALHAEGHRFDSDILHFFKQGVLMIIEVLPAGGTDGSTPSTSQNPFLVMRKPL